MSSRKCTRCAEREKEVGDQNVNFNDDHIIDYLQKTNSNPGEIDAGGLREIDHGAVSYPFCIVFIPFPVLSWLFPLLGHYGIGMSDGTIRDFSRNYNIDVNTISFGTPTKYVILNPTLALNGISGWDRAISTATHDYLQQRDKPVSHSKKKNPSYVAESLNYMKYNANEKWSRWSLFFLMLRHGRYTNTKGFLRTWLPFVLLMSVCTLLICIIDAVSTAKTKRR